MKTTEAAFFRFGCFNLLVPEKAGGVKTDCVSCDIRRSVQKIFYGSTVFFSIAGAKHRKNGHIFYFATAKYRRIECLLLLCAPFQSVTAVFMRSSLALRPPLYLC